jgi:hypothetical protein
MARSSHLSGPPAMLTNNGYTIHRNPAIFWGSRRVQVEEVWWRKDWRVIYDTTWDEEAQVSWRGNGFAYGRAGSWGTHTVLPLGTTKPAWRWIWHEEHHRLFTTRTCHLRPCELLYVIFYKLWLTFWNHKIFLLNKETLTIFKYHH